MTINPEDLRVTLETVEKGYKDLLKKYVKLMSWVFVQEFAYGRFQKFVLGEIVRWYLPMKLTEISNVMTIFLIERENQFLKAIDEECIELEKLTKENNRILFLVHSIIERLKDDIEKQECFAKDLGRASFFKVFFKGGIPVSTGLSILAGLLLTGTLNLGGTVVQLTPEQVQWVSIAILIGTLTFLSIFLSIYWEFGQEKKDLDIPDEEYELFKSLYKC